MVHNSAIIFKIIYYFYLIDFIPMSKLSLDLHDIYNKGLEIEKSLNQIIIQALENKVRMLEIIPGKGSGQLKKKVLRFLEKSEIKKLYHRIEKDSKNFGKIYVYFRYKE